MGLFLLGLGWSAATVAASATVADRAPLAARTDVQGVADMTMWLAAAAGGALSGLIVTAWGYAALNGFAGLLAGGVVLAAVVTAATTTATTTATPSTGPESAPTRRTRPS